MRRPLVAGNWKMNGSRDEAGRLVRGIVDGLTAGGVVDVVLCPPFILMAQVAALAGSGHGVTWGGQNVDTHLSGAYTGETSALMLRDHGATHVIVGHSERRTLYGESDEIVAEKFAVAQANGLVPILCIGETLAEHEAGRTESVVARQLDAVVERVGIAGLDRAVVAYEPVWAIGTGRTASPEQAQQVHGVVRARLAQLDGDVAARLRIVYGGSVKADSAHGLFAQPDIDGGLIGGASLNAEEFLSICRAAG